MKLKLKYLSVLITMSILILSVPSTIVNASNNESKANLRVLKENITGKLINSSKTKKINSGSLVTLVKQTKKTTTIVFDNKKVIIKNDKNTFYKNNTFKSNKKDYNQLEKDSIKWAKKLTKKEKSALSNYSKESYREDNTFLRTGKAKNAIKTKSEVLNIVRALNKNVLTKPMTVFRGVDADSFKLGLNGKNIAIGTTYLDPAFQSTSIYKKVALGFTNLDKANNDSNILLQINISKGKSGAYLFPLSKNNYEYEYLLNANQKMIITNIKNETSTVDISTGNGNKTKKVKLSYKLITMDLVK